MTHAIPAVCHQMHHVSTVLIIGNERKESDATHYRTDSETAPAGSNSLILAMISPGSLPQELLQGLMTDSQNATKNRNANMLTCIALFASRSGSAQGTVLLPLDWSRLALQRRTFQSTADSLLITFEFQLTTWPCVVLLGSWAFRPKCSWLSAGPSPLVRVDSQSGLV